MHIDQVVKLSAFAALLATTAPDAVEAAIVSYDWQITYTDENTDVNVVNLLFQVDESVPDSNSDPNFGDFSASAISVNWTSGPLTGTTVLPPDIIATLTTPSNPFLRILFDNPADPAIPDSMSFVFQAVPDPNVVPRLDPADLIAGFAYGEDQPGTPIFGDDGQIDFDSVAENAPPDVMAPVPLPASAALLAMSLGALALRGAARARRAKRRATRPA